MFQQETQHKTHQYIDKGVEPWLDRSPELNSVEYLYFKEKNNEKRKSCGLQCIMFGIKS